MMGSSENALLVRLHRAHQHAGPWLRSYAVFAILAAAMVVCVGAGAGYEREFRGSLEQGFQHRVELGDLASSVQQLRRVLEAPVVLDPGYFSGLVERSKEVELKSKAQTEAGRISDLVLPSKELGVLAGMQQGFERLAASHALIERAHNLKATLRLSDPADSPGIRKVSGALEEYVGAVSALRGARSSANALPSLQAASLAIAEHLQTAGNESRRKNAPSAWRDVLAILPSERGDLVDRLLADSRLVEDFLAQRARAISRLEQVSARVDSAERLLLQTRSSGGLLVASALLTWGGVGLGGLGLLLGAVRIHRARSEVAAIRSASAEVPQRVDSHANDEDSAPASRNAEALIAEKIAHELHKPGYGAADSADPTAVSVEGGSGGNYSGSGYAPARRSDGPSGMQLAAVTPVSVRDLAESAAGDTLEAVTSGYWIPAGSMAERRVALLDRQSEQLERHVGAVMAATETLAGRVDLMVQSLHLASEGENVSTGKTAEDLQKRVEDLQTVAMNLSLRFASNHGADAVLDDLEHLGEQLVSLTDSLLREIGNGDVSALSGRRVALSLEEARRLVAAASTLGERTETLLEDAQRFRRHTEALIRGIQEGAVTELPSVYLRGQNKPRRDLGR